MKKKLQSTRWIVNSNEKLVKYIERKQENNKKIKNKNDTEEGERERKCQTN